MSIVRVLQIRCDTYGRRVDGEDPRYGVEALRRRVQGMGWVSFQGNRGGPAYTEWIGRQLLAHLKTTHA